MDDAGRDDVEELTLEQVTVVRSRRPRALWGVLAAVAVVTGALVVISAGEDGGGTRPGLPVALGSAGSGRSEGAMAADSMLAWVTYAAGDDLPVLGGEAPAYRLTGNVGEAEVRALADALGVDGDLVHEGPAWKVAGDGGTLEVYEGGGAPWWYSSTGGGPVAGSGSSAGSAGRGVACPEVSDDGAVDCDVATVTTYPTCTASDGPSECVTDECPRNAECAAPPTTLVCPPDTYCDCYTPEGGIVGCEYLEPPADADCTVHADGYDPCPDDTTDPPAPPADLPSEDEARAIALELLEATGIDPEGAEVTVDGPYDAWYVTVEPRIDGVPSGLVATASVGSEGQVTNAGGYLGTPERLGDYPVLDTRAAIDRANARQGEGSAYRGGVAMDTAVGSAEAPAGDDPVTTAAAVKDRPAECEACDGNGERTVSTTIACPEGNSDCNDVGVIAEPPTTYPYPCKVQPDGTEICEAVEPGITCPQAAPPADEPLGAPETIECTPPVPEPGVEPVPLPEPEPVEIVLVDAEPSLVLLSAIDGSTDAYLVPGYRFTDADGGRVDLPAVADEALTGPPSTETTVPPRRRCCPTRAASTPSTRSPAAMCWSSRTPPAPPTPSSPTPTASSPSRPRSPTERSPRSASATTSTWACTSIATGSASRSPTAGGGPKESRRANWRAGANPQRAAPSRWLEEDRAEFVGDAAAHQGRRARALSAAGPPY